MNANQFLTHHNVYAMMDAVFRTILRLLARGTVQSTNRTLGPVVIGLHSTARAAVDEDPTPAGPSPRTCMSRSFRYIPGRIPDNSYSACRQHCLIRLRELVQRWWRGEMLTVCCQGQHHRDAH
jgi:hypothetical protein